MNGPHSRKKKDVTLKIDVEFIDIVKNLLEFFDGDSLKVKYWLTTKNLNLGDCEPLKLIALGRMHRVTEFIEASLNENKKPREWTLGWDGYYNKATSVESTPSLEKFEKVRVREVLNRKDLTESSFSVETNAQGERDEGESR